MKIIVNGIAHEYDQEKIGYDEVAKLANGGNSRELYVAVRKSDLREISEFGWLEEGAGAVGLFFFSGAFWLAVTLLSEHFTNLKTYLPWFGVCLLSMLFGVALLWIAHSHFKMRKNRLCV